MFHSQSWQEAGRKTGSAVWRRLVQLDSLSRCHSLCRHQARCEAPRPGLAVPVWGRGRCRSVRSREIIGITGTTVWAPGVNRAVPDRGFPGRMSVPAPRGPCPCAGPYPEGSRPFPFPPRGRGTGGQQRPLAAPPLLCRIPPSPVGRRG